MIVGATLLVQLPSDCSFVRPVIYYLYIDFIYLCIDFIKNLFQGLDIVMYC